MRKIIALIISLIFVAGILQGCTITTENNDEKIDIVCTIFPAYDWVREIICDEKERFSVTLLGNGSEMHSFQPSAKDIAKVCTADIFISVGGISEKWIGDIDIPSTVKQITLFDLLKADEVITVGEDSSHDHNHDKLQHTAEYDEHIWLSLKLAQRAVDSICTVICDADKSKGVLYKNNAAKYCERLQSLDDEYKGVISDSEDKTIIFADRFPFAYLVKDYQVKFYTPFLGCSSDTVASFETVARLAESVKTLDKKTVVVLENSSKDIVAAINGALGGDTVTAVEMNSCQAIDGKKVENTVYIDIMKNNLTAFKSALE